MSSNRPRKSVLPYLLALGIAVPAVELFLLIFITSFIGFWSTVGIIVGTGVMGVLLWRWQGFGVMARIRNSMLRGESPANTLIDGAMIFFAGGLLLTPGVITDLIGFSILIPWTRALIKIWVFKWIRTKFQFMDLSQMQGTNPFGDSTGQHPKNDLDHPDADIVDGEVVNGESEKIEVQKKEDDS